MKKIFTVMMVALAMTMMIACNEKDNTNSGDNNSTPQQTDYLPAGNYNYSYDNVRTDDHVLSILFDDERDFIYAIYHGHDVEEVEDDESYAFQGEYEFSGNSGKGILRLHNASDGSDAGTAEFTYDHNNTITVTCMGETVTMTKTY